MFLLGYEPHDKKSRDQIVRGRYYPYYLSLQNMQACYVTEWSTVEGSMLKTYEIDEREEADALAFVCWQRRSPAGFRSANTVDVTHFVRRFEEVVGLPAAIFLAHVYHRDSEGLYKAWTPEVTSGFEAFIKENASLISAYEKSVLCSSRWHCREHKKIDRGVYTPAVCLALEAKVDRLIERSELRRLIVVSDEVERQRAEMLRVEAPGASWRSRRGAQRSRLCSGSTPTPSMSCTTSFELRRSRAEQVRVPGKLNL